MTSRRLEKGSRLLVMVNVNKNSFAEVNYGTGKDVATEDIHDAGEPLKIQWRTELREDSGPSITELHLR